MANVIIEETTLYCIGSAIRSKTDGETLYKPSEMPAAIEAIETGYPEPTGSVSITENGTANVKDYATAIVNVPNSYDASDEGKVVDNGALVEQTSQTVTQNGTYDTTTNDEVVVNVAGGGGTTILSGTDAPTSAQGTNGNLYLKYGDPLSDFSVYKESSMTITVNDSNIVFDYTGGNYIGGQAYKQIDLTNIDSISYTLTSGHHSYNNYQTERFRPMVILENTINPSSNFVANSLYGSAETVISTNDTAVTNTIDTSGLTGNYWLVFCSYGCDAVLSNYVIDDGTNINTAYVKVNGSWTNLIGANINDVTT